MNPIPLATGRRAGALFLAVLVACAAGCATRSPAPREAPAAEGWRTDRPFVSTDLAGAAYQPDDDCAAIVRQLAQAEQKRRAAQGERENAWKAVVPFLVMTRKADAKSALRSADREAAGLRAQLGVCESVRG